VLSCRLVCVWACLALAVARVDGQTQSSSAASTRLKEARDLAAAGRMDAAEQALKKILAAEPNRYDALLMLGEVLEARGDLAGATTAYERAVRARSGSAVAHDKLGFVLGRQNRIPEALAEFARAIKLDPTLFDAQ
jgi:Tfp pilus assembly protein PilF